MFGGSLVREKKICILKENNFSRHSIKQAPFFSCYLFRGDMENSQNTKQCHEKKRLKETGITAPVTQLALLNFSAIPGGKNIHDTSIKTVILNKVIYIAVINMY